MTATQQKISKVVLFCLLFYTIMITIHNIALRNNHHVMLPSDYANILRQSLTNGSTVDIVKHKIAAISNSPQLKGCDIVIEGQQLDLQLVVNISGSIECAVKVTNQVAQTVRLLHLPLRFLYESIDNEQAAVDKAVAKYGHGDDLYFKTISKFPQILTVLIAWHSYTANHFEVANLPVKQYYIRSLPTAVCFDSSQSQECLDNLDPKVVFASSSTLSTSSKKSPDKDKSDTGTKNKDTLDPAKNRQEKAKSENTQIIDNDENQKTKSEKFPFFFHIVHNGHIDHNGRVSSGPLDITPYECKREQPVHRGDVWWHYLIPFYDHRNRVYDEVFVTSQFWGAGFFHSAIENLPRLAPYLDFLLDNPQILIHARRTFPQFAALGIAPERIIRGRVNARIVYVPQGGGCGWLNPPPGQLLSQRYHTYTRETFAENQLRRNSIVLIKRTTKRYLQQHDEIAEILSALAKEYDLDFDIFSDNPTPKFDAIVRTFYTARLVVAPHGAGIANVIFSQPGTGIIEVVCNPDHNFCYQSVAKGLGHVYIGLLSTKELQCGPLYVDIPYFKKVARNFISNMKEHQDKIS